MEELRPGLAATALEGPGEGPFMKCAASNNHSWCFATASRESHDLLTSRRSMDSSHASSQVPPWVRELPPGPAAHAGQQIEMERSTV